MASFICYSVTFGSIIGLGIGINYCLPTSCQTIDKNDEFTIAMPRTATKDLGFLIEYRIPLWNSRKN